MQPSNCRCFLWLEGNWKVNARDRMVRGVRRNPMRTASCNKQSTICFHLSFIPTHTLHRLRLRMLCCCYTTNKQEAVGTRNCWWRRSKPSQSSTRVSGHISNVHLLSLPMSSGSESAETFPVISTVVGFRATFPSGRKLPVFRSHR